MNINKRQTQVKYFMIKSIYCCTFAATLIHALLLNSPILMFLIPLENLSRLQINIVIWAAAQYHTQSVTFLLGNEMKALAAAAAAISRMLIESEDCVGRCNLLAWSGAALVSFPFIP